jgi:hypothetical protein
MNDFMETWHEFTEAHPEWRTIPAVAIAEYFFNSNQSKNQDLLDRIESLKKDVRLYRARYKGSETSNLHLKIQLNSYEKQLSLTGKLLKDITQAVRSNDKATALMGLGSLNEKYEKLVIEPYNESEELY